MEILYIIFQQNDMDRQRQYLLVCVVCCRFQLLPIFNLLWKPALIVGDNGQLQHLLGGHPGQTEIGSQQRGQLILVPTGAYRDSQRRMVAQNHLDIIVLKSAPAFCHC